MKPKCEMCSEPANYTYNDHDLCKKCFLEIVRTHLHQENAIITADCREEDGKRKFRY